MNSPRKPSPHYRRQFARLIREIDVGLADVDAGRVHDAEQVLAKLLKIRTPPSLAVLQRQARKFSRAKIRRLTPAYSLTQDARMSDNRDDLPARLAHMREALNLSQMQAAVDAQVSLETMRKAEIGATLKRLTRQRLEAWLVRADRRLTLRKGAANG